MKCFQRLGVGIKGISMAVLCLLLYSGPSWSVEDSTTLAPQNVFSPLKDKEIQDVGFLKGVLRYELLKRDGFFDRETDVAIRIVDDPTFRTVKFRFGKKVKVRKNGHLIPCVINRNRTYYAYVTRSPHDPNGFNITMYTKEVYRKIKNIKHLSRPDDPDKKKIRTQERRTQAKLLAPEIQFPTREPGESMRDYIARLCNVNPIAIVKSADDDEEFTFRLTPITDRDTAAFSVDVYNSENLKLGSDEVFFPEIEPGKELIAHHNGYRGWTPAGYKHKGTYEAALILGMRIAKANGYDKFYKESYSADDDKLYLRMGFTRRPQRSLMFERKPLGFDLLTQPIPDIRIEKTRPSRKERTPEWMSKKDPADRRSHIKQLSEQGSLRVITANTGEEIALRLTLQGAEDGEGSELFTIMAYDDGEGDESVLGYIDVKQFSIGSGFIRTEEEEMDAQDGVGMPAAIGTFTGKYRGIGRALMISAMRIAKENGYGRFEVHSPNEEERTLKFYRDLGFVRNQKGTFIFNFLIKEIPEIRVERKMPPPGDVTIADVGVKAADHQGIVNPRIRKLINRGDEIITVDGLEDFEIHVIGKKGDRFIDPKTGQRAHAGGLSTVGSKNEVKRLWVARGFYDVHAEEALKYLMHEAVELELWWQRTELLLKHRQIRGPDDTRVGLPTIREWIGENYEIARTLQKEYHKAAEKAYRTGVPPQRAPQYSLYDNSYFMNRDRIPSDIDPAKKISERRAHILALTKEEPRVIVANNGQRFEFTITSTDRGGESFTIQATVGGNKVGYVDVVFNAIKHGFPKSRFDENMSEDGGPGLAAIGTSVGSEYRGVGRALMVMAMRIAKENGYTKFLAIESNPESVGFYRWLGFKGDRDILEFDFLSKAIPGTKITARKIDIAGYLNAMRKDGKNRYSKGWAQIFGVPEDKARDILWNLGRVGIVTETEMGEYDYMFKLSPILANLSERQITRVCSLLTKARSGPMANWAALNAAEPGDVMSLVVKAVKTVRGSIPRGTLPDDITIADVGINARDHQGIVNPIIRELIARGDEIVYVYVLKYSSADRDLDGFEIHVIGDENDMFIDENTGQRAHAGGISTVGTDNEVKRLWITRGFYERFQGTFLFTDILQHESIELDLWWEKTEELLQAGEIGVEEDRNTVREWIQDNIEKAEALQTEYHNKAQSMQQATDHHVASGETLEERADSYTEYDPRIDQLISAGQVEVAADDVKKFLFKLVPYESQYFDSPARFPEKAYRVEVRDENGNWVGHIDVDGNSLSYGFGPRRDDARPVAVEVSDNYSDREGGAYKGIGRSLMAFAMGLAVHNGYKVFECTEVGMFAESFYASLGFNEVDAYSGWWIYNLVTDSLPRIGIRRATEEEHRARERERKERTRRLLGMAEKMADDSELPFDLRDDIRRSMPEDEGDADITISDVGLNAPAHESVVNKNIRALVERGDDSISVEGLEDFEIHVIGNKDDMFIDEDTGQRAHAGGISTVGSENAVKRLWIARGFYDAQTAEALNYLRHESVELGLWWRRTELLLESIQIRGPDDTETDLPTIREWIGENAEIARTLQKEYHRAAETTYPTGNPVPESTEHSLYDNSYYMGRGRNPSDIDPAGSKEDRMARVQALSEEDPPVITADNGERFVFTMTPMTDKVVESFSIQAKVGDKNAGYVDVIGNAIKFGFPKSKFDEIMTEDGGPDLAAIGTNLGGEYRGVGRALMVMAMRIAKENGYTKFMAIGANQDAIGFYRGLGFEGSRDMMEFDFLSTSLPETDITARKVEIAGYLNAMRDTGGAKHSKGWSQIFGVSDDRAWRLLRDLGRVGIVTEIELGQYEYTFKLDPILAGLSEDQLGRVCSILAESGDEAMANWPAFNAADPDHIWGLVVRAVQEVIHEENMELTPAIPQGKVLWHVFENELIPEVQQSMGFITRVNHISTRTGGAERVLVLNKGEKLDEVIAGLSADPKNIIHVISNSGEIDNIPDGVKIAIVKGEMGDYVQLEGVMAVSRALDIEDIQLRNRTLRLLYRALTGEVFEGKLPETDDPKALARAIVFLLPKIIIKDYKELKSLNESLLQFIQAA